ncbi:MAG: hypothetical protein LBJ93_02775 [Clostridiales bacterium]|nr:hypothetical protein [Clostridiales bacterium]
MAQTTVNAKRTAGYNRMEEVVDVVAGLERGRLAVIQEVALLARDMHLSRSETDKVVILIGGAFSPFLGNGGVLDNLMQARQEGKVYPDRSGISRQALYLLSKIFDDPDVQKQMSVFGAISGRDAILTRMKSVFMQAFIRQPNQLNNLHEIKPAPTTIHSSLEFSKLTICLSAIREKCSDLAVNAALTDLNPSMKKLIHLVGKLHGQYNGGKGKLNIRTLYAFTQSLMKFKDGCNELLKVTKDTNQHSIADQTSYIQSFCLNLSAFQNEAVRYHSQTQEPRSPLVESDQRIIETMCNRQGRVAKEILNLQQKINDSKTPKTKKAKLTQKVNQLKTKLNKLKSQERAFVKGIPESQSKRIEQRKARSEVRKPEKPKKKIKRESNAR